MNSRLFLVFVALLAIFATACSNSLYDETKITSGREHLADEAKGADLLQSMDKAGITRIVLAGAYNSTFFPDQPTDWASAAENNELLVSAVKRVPGRLLAFPLIDGAEPDPQAYARRMFDAGARGFTLANGTDRQRRMPLNDPRLWPFFRWCELNHLPLLIDVDFPAHGDELIALLRDYPHLSVIGGDLIGLVGDLPTLRLVLKRFNSLYLDFSFGSDEGKAAAYRTIADNRDAFRALLDDFAGRFIWGTQIVVRRSTGRNVDWLTQYMDDGRHFLESGSVNLKFFLGDRAVLVKQPGLALPAERLYQLYTSNIEQVVDVREPTVAAADLDRLLTGAPAGAAFDAKADRRLIVACVTGWRNPVEGLYSARLKNILTGALTDWREVTGLAAPIQIAAVAPLDEWIPRVLKLDRHLAITALPNAAALEKLLRERPETIGFVAFDDLTPDMRVIPLDGEDPTLSYVRDCSRRGGALIKNYFHDYTLLVPLALRADPPANLVFDPHRLFNVVLSGDLLPVAPPPGAPDQELEPYADALFKVATPLQTADYTVMALPSIPAANCEPAAEALRRCVSAEWLDALDYAGVDTAVVPALHPGDEATLAAHYMNAATPAAAATAALRGEPFAVMVADTAAPDWDAAAFATRIAREKAAGPVFVFLMAQTDASEIATRLVAAGATTVLLIGPDAPRLLDYQRGRPRVLAPGSIAGAGTAIAAEPPVFLVQHRFYGNELKGIDLIPAAGQGNRVRSLHSRELIDAYRELFAASARKTD